MFRITNGRGFQMTFENGWTVSVQWGYNSYCGNKMKGVYGQENQERDFKCMDAEIAAWDEEGVWYQFETEDVKGWCTANEVAEFIELISKK